MGGFRSGTLGAGEPIGEHEVLSGAGEGYGLPILSSTLPLRRLGRSQP
jgi:hypothetical protein